MFDICRPSVKIIASEQSPFSVCRYLKYGRKYVCQIRVERDALEAFLSYFSFIRKELSWSLAHERFYTFTLREVTVQSRSNFFVFVVFAPKALYG